MDTNKKEFIEFMIKAEVLKFGEFTTKSGRLTPYFINTGNYEKGSQIAGLGNFYSNLIKETCGDNFTAYFGPAYKGIPLAVAVASSMFTKYNIDKPFLFNRKETKDHGEGGNIVGYMPKDGDNVIIIEDVITAGTAIRETLPVLKACGDIKVTEMFISVNRCEFGLDETKTAIMELKENYGINVHSIVDVRDIYEYLKQSDFDKTLITKMENYMSTYCLI